MHLHSEVESYYWNIGKLVLKLNYFQMEGIVRKFATAVFFSFERGLKNMLALPYFGYNCNTNAKFGFLKYTPERWKTTT